MPLDIGPGEISALLGPNGAGKTTRQNVRENLWTQGRLHRMPAAQVRSRMKEVIALLGLRGFCNRAVRALSGDQRRRL